MCPEDTIVRLYWICNTHCDSIWWPKLQFWDLAACSCLVKQRKFHQKKRGRGVNSLLSQIQNTDYITSLISGLFCASGGSWRKYERASSLELFLMSGRGHRHTSSLHISCLQGATAESGPCCGNARTVMSPWAPQSSSAGPAMPWCSPRAHSVPLPKGTEERSTQQIKHLPSWKQRSSSGRGWS